MNVLGLDLALGQTGYATQVESGVFSPPKIKGVERLRWIRDYVMQLVFSHAIGLVVIEGYSYGSKGKALFDIGELGGVVRVELTDNGVPWAEVSPATLKKLATGKGNVGKEEVMLAAWKRLQFEKANNNEVDARWLLEAALQRYDLPDATDLPKGNVAALSVVEWPKDGHR